MHIIKVAIAIAILLAVKVGISFKNAIGIAFGIAFGIVIEIERTKNKRFRSHNSVHHRVRLIIIIIAISLFATSSLIEGNFFISQRNSKIKSTNSEGGRRNNHVPFFRRRLKNESAFQPLNARCLPREPFCHVAESPTKSAPQSDILLGFISNIFASRIQ